jgi:beta-N-acetylhexosaminidase
VSEVAETYCATLIEAGIRCTLKHFPGLGGVAADTHVETADLTIPEAELAAADWVPFRALMNRAGILTMLGHARLVAVDPQRPSSFSRAVIDGLLRRSWRHDGILLTDDFTMEAVFRSPEGLGGASVAALNAGIDLILVSYDPDQYYVVTAALIAAHRHGRLRPDTLLQSDARLGSADKRP